MPNQPAPINPEDAVFYVVAMKDGRVVFSVHDEIVLRGWFDKMREVVLDTLKAQGEQQRLVTPGQYL